MVTDEMRAHLRAQVRSSGIKQRAIARELGIPEYKLSWLLTGRLKKFPVSDYRAIMAIIFRVGAR